MKYEKLRRRLVNRLREVKMLKSNCERVKRYRLKAYYEGQIETLEWILNIMEYESYKT